MDEVKEKLVRATVARGRTIHVPAPGRTPPYIAYGPGQEVRLPADEVASLRTTGFLVDPGQPAPPVAEGPNFT